MIWLTNLIIMGSRVDIKMVIGVVSTTYWLNTNTKEETVAGLREKIANISGIKEENMRLCVDNTIINGDYTFKEKDWGKIVCHVLG